MGRHKNQDGAFVPAGLKIRFDVINRIYQNPTMSVKIPSARELSARFHLSPSTVTLELQKLVKEGYLTGKRGSGTYTNPTMINFIPRSISRKIIGVLVHDGKLLLYDAIDWAAQSYCGMALSPDVGHPRFITLNSNTIDSIYEELITQNLSGLIWVHPIQSWYDMIRQLIRNGLPVVAVKCETPDIPSVSYSFSLSGRMIAEAAAKENRHTIFYLPTNNDRWTLQRVAGVEDYIKQHPQAELRLQSFQSIQNCTEELETHFAAGDIPDAIYCNGEYIYVMLELAQKYNIDILDRCRLFAEELHVRKCNSFHGHVIHYPFQEIGDKAVEMMQIQFENPQAQIPVYYAEPELRFQHRSDSLP